VVGSATAIRRFLAAGTGGAIVNVSSHQARRAVPGALPYVTAKAAIEGLTRALAVEYGPRGIRVNAVALGSIATERYEAFLREQEPAAAQRVEEEMRLLHPVGARPGGARSGPLELDTRESGESSRRGAGRCPVADEPRSRTALRPRPDARRLLAASPLAARGTSFYGGSPIRARACPGGKSVHESGSLGKTRVYGPPRAG
jgi:NAD(P)-dependent dehydrogenase (short-subunit alcohol dehydrogenase family)